jgi:hypothetical protein
MNDRGELTLQSTVNHLIIPFFHTFTSVLHTFVDVYNTLIDV